MVAVIGLALARPKRSTPALAHALAPRGPPGKGRAVVRTISSASKGLPKGGHRRPLYVPLRSTVVPAVHRRPCTVAVGAPPSVTIDCGDPRGLGNEEALNIATHAAGLAARSLLPGSYSRSRSPHPRSCQASTPEFNATGGRAVSTTHDLESISAPAASVRNEDKRISLATSLMAHRPDPQWHRVREGNKTVHRWMRRYARAKPRPYLSGPRAPSALRDTRDEATDYEAKQLRAAAAGVTPIVTIACEDDEGSAMGSPAPSEADDDPYLPWDSADHTATFVTELDGGDYYAARAAAREATRIYRRQWHLHHEIAFMHFPDDPDPRRQWQQSLHSMCWPYYRARHARCAVRHFGPFSTPAAPMLTLEDWICTGSMSDQAL